MIMKQLRAKGSQKQIHPRLSRAAHSAGCLMASANAVVEQMESRMLLTATPIVGFQVGAISGSAPTSLTAFTVDSSLASAPVLARANLTSSALTHGFSATNWTTSATPTETKDFFFDMQVKAGFGLSLSEFDLNYRSSTATSGPTLLEVEYSRDGGNTFTPIASGITLTALGSSTGATLTPLNLTTFAGLQNLVGGNTVRFRLEAYGAGATTGTFAVYDNTSNTTNDLAVLGTSSVIAAPTVTTLSPTSGAPGTTVSITGTNFRGVSAVTFGSTSVTSGITFIDDSDISVAAPSGPTGTVPVNVTTPSGTSSSGDTFMYTGGSMVPTIASVTVTSPNTGVGTTRTLVAMSVAPESGATTSSLNFYLDNDGTPGPSAGDTLIPGTPTTSTDVNGINYTLTYTPSSTPLLAGSYPVYATETTSSSATVSATSATNLVVTTPIIAFAPTTQSGNTVSVNVTRSSDTFDTASVSYNIASGTAVAGTNYSVSSAGGTLSFAAGATSASVSISILNPSTQIGDDNVTATLSNPLPLNFGTAISGSTTETVLLHQTPRAFVAGDVAIYRIGDGVVTLASTGNVVYIDEYNPSGTLVQSFPLPEYATGTANSEGGMTLSADGHSLIIPGYVSASGSATALASSTVSRAIDEIGPNGVINSSTTLPSTDFGTGNIRAAASDNGSHIWISSSTKGVLYTTLNSTSASTSISTTTASMRNLVVYNGQLYATSGSGEIHIGMIGTGLPTAGPQTYSNLASGAITTASPYAFAFVHLNGPGTAPDTLYVSDDSSSPAGGIYKFSLQSGTWTQVGNVIQGSNIRGLTATVSNNVVTLFATSGGFTSTTFTPGGNLYELTDTAGSGNAPSTTTLPSPIAVVATGEEFAGVALVPTVVAVPAVNHVSPATDVAAGGASVTITGTNFTPGSTVKFGAVTATSVTYVSPTQLSAVDPAGSGAVDVTVTTVDGTSATSSADVFTYTGGLPAWLDPASAATWDGTHLVVTGVATIIGDPGTDEPLITATIAGAKLGIAPITAKQVHIGSLMLSNGASATLPSGSSTPLIVILSVAPTIDTSSKLDLGNNDLDIPAGSLATIKTLISRGFNLAGGGKWDGTGITSATAAANTTHLTALGYMVNNNGTSTPIISTIDGATLASTDLLVKYTYYGDANLSGKVDGDDYSRIDAAFGTTATGWMNGDFNYDGSINGSDYTLIDNAFNTQSLILANPATTSAAPLAAVATAESKTKATSTAIATPTEATTTTTNFFSEKRVKGSLIMDVMELVAGK